MLRIDRAIIPSGLIRNGRTYSLIWQSGKLYIINTGPAGNEVNARGFAQQAAVNAAHRRIEKKVAEGQARLAQTNLDALAQENRHSKVITPTQVTAVTLKEKWGGLVLGIRGSAGKFDFRLPLDKKEEVEQLRQRLRGAAA